MPESRVDADARFVMQAKKGDKEAFGKLHDLYAEAIYRFLYARLNNRMDAEDLTGEVFLRAWRSLPNYRPKGHLFSAYLFRIARNLLTDHYRQAKRVNVVEEHDERLLQTSEDMPADIIIAKQEYQTLKKTLGKIREDYRNVLILRFISGLSPDETAEAMGRSPGAVRVLQHRALSALRKQMGKDTR